VIESLEDAVWELAEARAGVVRALAVRDRAVGQLLDSPQWQVQFLRYGVREGREASEDGDPSVAFIANCNSSFILPSGGLIECPDD